MGLGGCTLPRRQHHAPMGRGKHPGSTRGLVTFISRRHHVSVPKFPRSGGQGTETGTRHRCNVEAGASGHRGKPGHGRSATGGKTRPPRAAATAPGGAGFPTRLPTMPRCALWKHQGEYCIDSTGPGPRVGDERPRRKPDPPVREA